MKHPTTRSERRAVRDTYISRRKFIKMVAQGNYNSRHYKIPHIGQEREFLQYLKYIRYMESSDDEKKILEVEHALDHPEPPGPWWPQEPPEGFWHPPVWGMYAKYNLTCACYRCRTSHAFTAKKEKRKRREKLKKDIKEGLEDV